MAQTDDFQELLNSAKAGDQNAWAKLYQTCETDIRRFIKFRIRGRVARRYSESDILQSIWLDIHVRLALGEYELNSWQDLLALLRKCVGDKAIDKNRRLDTQKRAFARETPIGPEALEQITASDPTPSHVLSQSELLDEVLRRLPPGQRRIAEERAAGRTWGEIAADLGKSEEAIRKEYRRAVDQVTRELAERGIHQ